MSKTSEEKIVYRIEEPFFIIQFKSPETLNALSYDDYIYLTTLLHLSNETENCYFTILTSSGRFFSSGADFNTIPSNLKTGKDNLMNVKETEKWLENFLCKNQYITQSFIKHEKILIAALNGPAIGLSAAIVLLCDLVYAINIDQIYLQFPFSQLGLSNEGAVSVTMPQKLGRNKSFEKLLFAKRVSGNEIKDSIILDTKITYEELQTKCNNDRDQMVNTFNSLIIKELKRKCTNLYLPTILKMKSLLRDESQISQLELLNTKEVNSALPFWINGVPQGRFQKLKQLKMLQRANRNKL